MIEKDREKVLRDGIEEGFYPRYLCKYWSFESAKRFLESNQIKYSSCCDFNDPFEGAFDLIGNVSKAEWSEFIKRFSLTSFHDITMGTDMYEEAKKIMENTIHEAIECVGIFCLAQRNDNLLMWAHYAKEHEGVCLMFDLLKDTKAFSSLHKMVYTTDYLNFNFVTDLSRVNDILVHKSVEWMYEGEYRVLKLNGVGLGPVNPEALVEIDFGCRMSMENRQKIKDLVSQNPKYKVQFKQAGMHSNDYRILICDEDDKRICWGQKSMNIF